MTDEERVVYIGDGVYLRKTAQDYTLYTFNGITESNHIYLDSFRARELVTQLTQEPTEYFEENFCIDCGTEISNNDLRCLECENKREFIDNTPPSDPFDSDTNKAISKHYNKEREDGRT